MSFVSLARWLGLASGKLGLPLLYSVRFRFAIRLGAEMRENDRFLQRSLDGELGSAEQRASSRLQAIEGGERGQLERLDRDLQRLLQHPSATRNRNGPGRAQGNHGCGSSHGRNAGASAWGYELRQHRRHGVGAEHGWVAHWHCRQRA